MSIETILIFNRGEIACRVIRTARALGRRTVAVYTKDEGDPPHARLADTAIRIDADRRAYLDPAVAIEAARRAGADGLHPGYGFLSESADLARACAEAGVTFIGPPPAVIEAMGDKAAARRIMQGAGVPCVPGYDGAAQDDATLRAEAERIGWPVMVKAAAGGGGKGMRLVEGPGAFDAALRAARSEARAAFGSDVLILERALQGVRHVEVQVFGDAHGAILHLGERDCSVQRRHQKIIEETPSPAVDAALREVMGATAVAAARAVGYVGAGTVEFLLAPDGGFYFLEMNTRLQVEHPVTEAVTGLDLVAWQIRVADGELLALAQAEVRFEGAAIEARLYAEAPDLSFLPRAGTVSTLDLPQRDGVRIDHALAPGAAVSPHYDPLLAKVIAHGPDRETARRRLLRALENVFVGGVETNRGFLLRVLDNAAFAAGAATTGLIAEEQARLAPPPIAETDFAVANLLFDVVQTGAAGPLRARRRLAAEGRDALVVTRQGDGGGFQMSFESGAAHELALISWTAPLAEYTIDGVRRLARACRVGRGVQVSLPERDLVFNAVFGAAVAATPAADQPRSPMAGRVVSVHVAAGDRIGEGDLVAVIEAMKMEHEIRAPRGGIIMKVWAEAGQDIPRDCQVAEIAGEGEADDLAG